MPSLTEAMDALAVRIGTAGHRVVADPRDVNPPAVYLAPPTLAYRFAAASADVEWTVWVITVGAGRRQALAALSPMLVDVVTAIAAPVQAAPSDWTPPDGGAALPAYVLSWTERLRG